MRYIPELTIGNLTIDALSVGDDEVMKFGNDLDFGIVYDSGDNRLEIRNAADAVLAHLTAAGLFTAAGGFSGALTGNVTGNCSGSSGSCTGNAATASNATQLGGKTWAAPDPIGSGTPNTVAGTTGTFSSTIGAGGRVTVTESATSTGFTAINTKTTGDFSVSNVVTTNAGSAYWGMSGNAGRVISTALAGELIFNNRTGAGIVFSSDTSYTRRDLVIEPAGAITLAGDLAVNGGDITSTASTFNLLNAGPTTINFGGAATTLGLGAATGTCTINNATTSVKALTATGLMLTAASASGGAGFRIPHGAAPTSPENGDVWTTTAGLYIRVNNVTTGPLLSSELISVSATTYNAALGYSALISNTTGYRNIAIGAYALEKNTEGYDNIGLGWQALQENLTGRDNNAIGYFALRLNTTGDFNNAIGDFASNNNIGGDYNCAFGQSALKTNASGDYNVCLGASAGLVLTGSSNTCVGGLAGDGITTGSYNIMIGRGVDAVSPTGSYQLNIGDAIIGDLSTGILSISGGLHVGGTSSAGDNNLLADGNVTAAQFRLSALNTAPASAAATGTLGEIRIDANHIYVCTATDTWVRAAIATWA